MLAAHPTSTAARRYMPAANPRTRCSTALSVTTSQRSSITRAIARSTTYAPDMLTRDLHRAIAVRSATYADRDRLVLAKLGCVVFAGQSLAQRPREAAVSARASLRPTRPRRTIGRRWCPPSGEDLEHLRCSRRCSRPGHRCADSTVVVCSAGSLAHAGENNAPRTTPAIAGLNVVRREYSQHAADSIKCVLPLDARQRTCKHNAKHG
jgi:hypothetical protein